MYRKSGYCPNSCTNYENVFSSTTNSFGNDCNEKCVAFEGTTGLDNARDLSNRNAEGKLQKQRKRANNSEREKISSFETRSIFLSKDLQLVSHGQKTTQRSKQAPTFNCILEQEELNLSGYSGLESEDFNENVKLPNIGACIGEAVQSNATKYKERTTSTCEVAEMILPPLKGTYFSPKRKVAVSCSPFGRSSNSLPLLKNSGITNIVNGCNSKQIGLAGTLGSCSPDLTDYSDGLTMSDRSEMNSIHLLAKKSRQKSRALRRKYDGLASPVNDYRRSLNKR